MDIETETTASNENAERTYRTKDQTIEYFRHLAHVFGVQSHRSACAIETATTAGKSEAYENAAFELERNSE